MFRKVSNLAIGDYVLLGRDVRLRTHMPYRVTNILEPDANRPSRRLVFDGTTHRRVDLLPDDIVEVLTISSTD